MTHQQPSTQTNDRQHDSDIVAWIPALRAFARSFCRQPEDADDLVQATLLKGIANIHQYQPGTNMKSWLFTIMRNTFYTRYRQMKREEPGSNDCVAGLPVVPPTQEWSVRGREMQAAMNRLPEVQRQAVVLIAVLGTSYEDAAQICGCEMGTIKSRLSRARSRLAVELGEASPSKLFQENGTRSELVQHDYPIAM